MGQCGFVAPCAMFDLSTSVALLTQLTSSLLQLPASGPTQTPVPSSLNEGSPPPPEPASKGSLDTMLGLLQSDLSRRGIPTQAKGLCGSCNKPIAGQVSAAVRAVRRRPTDPSSLGTSLCAVPFK